MRFLSRRGAVFSAGTAAADSPARRFPLLRYFVATSVLVIGVVTALTGALFVRLADANFTDRTQSRSVAEAAHFAALFYYSVWLSSPSEGSEGSLHSVSPSSLETFAERTAFGLSIVQINFLDLDGTIVFSTDPGLIGTIPARETPPAVAHTGVPLASVERQQIVRDLAGALRSMDIVNTYVLLTGAPPDAPQEGSPYGILQMLQDVTLELALARGESLRVAVAGSATMAMVLFTLLFLLILRADRIIDGNHRRLVKQQEDLEVAQAQNIQSAKLAAIGQLVSGVAHELNHPLMAIGGLTELLADKASSRADSEDLRRIHMESQRAVRIVRNLLAFSHASRQEKTYVSINETVEAALDLRLYELSVKNIEAVVEMQPNLPWTLADAQEIQQLILNLCMNAEQALMESSGHAKKIWVKTEQAGEMIQITVRDNGPGIPDEVVGRVFDPFFTTKDVGSGTGLGLSICFGIVQNHGGTIRAENVRPTGARFVVELPIVSPASPEEGRPADESSVRSSPA